MVYRNMLLLLAMQLSTETCSAAVDAVSNRNMLQLLM